MFILCELRKRHRKMDTWAYGVGVERVGLKQIEVCKGIQPESTQVSTKQGPEVHDLL